jgi:ankyrin repeat protein
LDDSRLPDAAMRKDRAGVLSLLKQRAKVNASQADGSTALAWAAHWNDIAMAEALLKAGADANLANEFGVTPLSLACVNGNLPMVQRLLAAKASPNAVARTGDTAFLNCVRSGNVDTVKLMLEAKADANLGEKWRGQTPLMWAAAEKHSTVVKALVDHGADVNAKSRGGFTALQFAAQQGDIESAKILLAAGANVNDADPEDGMTALLTAIGSNQTQVASLLVESGADVNVANKQGVSALHFAAGRRNMNELTKTLLAKGANPDVRQKREPEGATPFYLAANAGNVAAMRLLVTAGADPKIHTRDNTTAIMVASGVGRYESRGADAEKAGLEAIKYAVELGLDVNAKGENDWTALHGAAYTGADDIAAFLVSKGGKLEELDKYGQTPLSIASAVVTEGLADFADVRPRRWRDSTVNLLLKLGAVPVEMSGVKVAGSLAVRPIE